MLKNGQNIQNLVGIKQHGKIRTIEVFGKNFEES